MDGWVDAYIYNRNDVFCVNYISAKVYSFVYLACIYDFTHATVFKAVFCRAPHMMYCTGAMLTRTSGLGFGV